MTALAVRAALTANAAAPASAGAAVAAAPDTGFAALLGKMSAAKQTPTLAHEDTASKPKSDAKSVETALPADGSAQTLSALQSLEAALAGLGAPAPAAVAPERAVQSKAIARAAAPVASEKPAALGSALAKENAAALGSTLASVAGALEGSGAGALHALAAGAAWDGSGKTPLKAQLQADPTLGLTDFQMKTHLAATGATPARVGGAPLVVEASWIAAAPGSPAKTPDAGLAAPPRAHRASRDAPSGHSGAPSPIAFSTSPLAVAPPAAASGAARRGDDTAGSVATSVVASRAPTGDANVPTLTLPLAQLPAFIADSAATLAAPAEDAASATGAATPATQAKAAQAVKELNIALDPADLGQMTLKLRLAGGKLSVTIEVANPQTLVAIESDRSLIAARIAGGEQALEDLVIQRQAPTASTSETASRHASSSDSDASSPETESETAGRQKGAGRRRGGGGAFGDLLV